MRVLHVAAGNLYGGVERVLVEMASVAGAARHAFALAFEGRVSRELQARRAAVQVFGPVRFSRPLTVWQARRTLRAQWDLDACAAVVCHSPWSYAVAAPVLPRDRAVLWAHNVLDGTHWTERRVRRRPPALVIANSRHTAGSIRAWLGASRVEVVYPPVTPMATDLATREHVRGEMGVPPDTPVILIASRLERLKGHVDLLYAVASLAGECELWLAGAPQRAEEAAYDRELRDLAAALGIAGRVRFLGERTDVNRLLAAADILCQPNTTPESFGITYVEAMSAGLPVVTTRGGGADEVLGDGGGVLVAPGDRAALTAVLEELVRDPARRAALGAAGRARAQALCSPATQVEAIERHLSALAGARA